jgi:DNA-binding XRE family transcriptional regulator
MLFQAEIYKDGKFWLAEIAALDAMTQGHSKKEAIAMLKDWVRSSLNQPGAAVDVIEIHPGEYVVETESSAKMLALFLQRQRLKTGLTVRQVAHKLGFKSHNAYAQYETGKSEPSLSQLQRFVHAIAPKQKVDIKVG